MIHGTHCSYMTLLPGVLNLLDLLDLLDILDISLFDMILLLCFDMICFCFDYTDTMQNITLTCDTVFVSVSVTVSVTVFVSVFCLSCSQ
jgi:hypothetical protein